MTLAVGNLPRIVAAMVLFQAIASWPGVFPSYADPTAWSIQQWPLDAALRRESEDTFLRQNLESYSAIRMIEEHVPRGEHVLSMNAIAEAYTTRNVLAGFQGAFNQLVTDTIYVGAIDGFQPSIAVVFQFPERAIRHIRILQTIRAAPHTQWNVHEVRYFHKGVELPRSSAWRLRAWPNPWEVQLAFDNSPATRWRSWEPPAPGMYIETDFGTDQTVDQVVADTSPDGEWSVGLQVETMIEKGNAKGRWVKLSGKPEVRKIPVPEWLRRAATYELRARGVNYLIVQDGDYGAADYLEDPDLWGFHIVARDHDVTLYKIEPVKQ
jgi:hypothetical protein